MDSPLEIDVYSGFEKSFVEAGSGESGSESTEDIGNNAELKRFFLRYGGKSFNQGVYRIFTSRRGMYFSTMVGSAFARDPKELLCFGSDWLGRIFALDAKRVVDGAAGVVMYEPGTGQALDIPCNLSTFHNSELVEFSDAALAIGFFKQWLDAGGAVPTSAQCVTYKKLLFLGGQDDLNNLVLGDMAVYWGIASQIIAKLVTRR
jgi:hypothetical protein